MISCKKSSSHKLWVFYHLPVDPVWINNKKENSIKRIINKKEIVPYIWLSEFFTLIFFSFYCIHGTSRTPGLRNQTLILFIFLSTVSNYIASSLQNLEASIYKHSNIFHFCLYCQFLLECFLFTWRFSYDININIAKTLKSLTLSWSKYMNVEQIPAFGPIPSHIPIFLAAPPHPPKVSQHEEPNYEIGKVPLKADTCSYKVLRKG